MNLTPKQETRSAKVERFCIEVVRPGNSLSDAYRIAFQPKNCSAKTIHEKASRLRKTGKVEARVAELMAPVIASAQVDKARWLEKVHRCALYDTRKMFDAHGHLIEICQLDDDTAPGIAGFECIEKFKGKGASRIMTGRTKKVKLTDRLQALVLLGKAMGWISEEGSMPPASPLEQATTETLLQMLKELEDRMAKAAPTISQQS